MEENNGSQISGHANVTFHGNTVIGKEASLKVNNNRAANPEPVLEITTLIDTLISKINVTNAQIAEREDILDAVMLLKEEIGKNQPNKITIRSVAKAMLESLKYTKDIAPIAGEIWHKITTFLS